MAVETTFRFRLGDSFDNLDDLTKKVKEFEERCFVQLYKRSSRSIECTLRRALKKKYNEQLQFTEARMTVILRSRH